jgi:hypothetical protein
MTIRHTLIQNTALKEGEFLSLKRAILQLSKSMSERGVEVPVQIKTVGAGEGTSFSVTDKASKQSLVVQRSLRGISQSVESLSQEADTFFKGMLALIEGIGASNDLFRVESNSKPEDWAVAIDEARYATSDDHVSLPKQLQKVAFVETLRHVKYVIHGAQAQDDMTVLAEFLKPKNFPSGQAFLLFSMRNVFPYLMQKELVREQIAERPFQFWSFHASSISENESLQMRQDGQNPVLTVLEKTSPKLRETSFKIEHIEDRAETKPKSLGF